MKIKVTKDLCEIKENEIWNVGDYNVHTVQVELSPEFNGLVNKVRYFIEDNSYDMLITDNIAEVPYEATLTEGTIKIGVYGYDANTNILVQSTSPVNKYISSGTYTGEADNTQPLTPTDKEQMETAIQKNTDDITDLKANKQDKLISGVNIKTINNESILSSGNLTLVTEETDPIFTNSPAYSITDNDITYWNNKANMSDIPDVSNFITNTVDDLVNYYTKTETFTKQEVNNLISAITTMDIQVVQTLPVQDISTTTIYLVPKTTAEQNDAYDEYIYVSNAWEHIGSTEVDLTDYVKNTDYASSSTGGVIKTGSNVNVDNNGVIYADNQTYSDYSSSSNNNFISKGTLENVITGKNLETANNKVTSISSESTDTQYPSAKCVYDNDVIIKDDVNTKYDYLFSLTNLFGKITGTGTSVTLNDTSNTLLKMELNGNTTQNTPTGKNLYHMSSATPNSSTSYTINNNNSIRVYNTTSSWRSAYTELTVPAGNYAFSFRSIITSGAKQVIIQKVIGGTATDFKTMTITNETTFTLDSETLLRFVFFSTTGTNEAGDVTYSNIQLEVGSSVTSFEPYTGGQPAPSPSYPQEIHTITGNNTVLIRSLNLWDTVLEAGGYSLITGKKVSNNYHRSANYIPITPNSAMEFMKPVGKYTRVLFYDKNKNFLSAPDVIYTNYNYSEFTSPNNAYYMTFLIDSYSSFNNDLMIYYGSTSKPYEAYKEQTYPINLGDIELCKIGDYEDILFKNTINSEYYNSSLELNKWYIRKIISKISSYNGETITTPYISTTGGLNTGSTIYYVSDSPTYTLLNDTLKTQLDNMQYALAYDTQTNISQTNNDLPFIINAETYVDLTDYVKNTDYATSSKGGVVKTGYGSNVDSNGNLYASNFSYANYQTAGNNNFISKGTLENVITGKGLIDSSYHDSTKQDIEDNTLTTIHKTIPTAINEVDSIAKGANQALSYVNYSAMVTAFNSLANNVYNVGQNVMIITLQVPDLWISGIESTSSTYTYTTDEAITTALSTNGYIQVGYYKLSALETQKVDLTDYEQNTNKTTTISSSSTNTEYPSAKAVYDYIQSLNGDEVNY